MKPMTLAEIADAVRGVLNHKAFAAHCVCDVFTDTRTPIAGGLFVPIKGENADGHTYINQAFASGAVCALTEHYIEADTPIIRVSSTREALLDLAGHYRRKFDIPVVAVTGSAGKTTTKDLIASVLSERFRVLKTKGNLNNEIGLSLMLLAMDGTHQAAVFEMGMSGFGEIHKLSRAARPDVAVIINAGTAHIEKLGSREGILQAKAEIMDFLHDDALVFLNGEDDMLVKLRGTRKNIHYYGEAAGACAYATDITPQGLAGIGFVCHGGGGTYPVYVPLPGEHMVSNALAAASVGHALGLTGAEIASGIAKFVPSAMRMDVIKLANGGTIISDVYNANPAAMKAALAVLRDEAGHRTAILGDMWDLGAFAEILHAEVGAYAASIGIDTIICIGEESRAMAKAAKAAGGNAYHYESKEAFMPDIHTVFSNGGTALVKASRGMGFEEITEGLRRNESRVGE